MRQNEDTRRISAWVAIGVIPTIVGGLFGMNLGGIPGGDHVAGFAIVTARSSSCCARAVPQVQAGGLVVHAPSSPAVRLSCASLAGSGVSASLVASVDRRGIGAGRLVAATEAAQQVGPRGVEQVIARRGRRPGRRPRRGRPPDRRLGDGHGPVEGDDRRRRDGEELVVEGDDLAPVGVRRRRRVAVHGVDRRLDLVRPGRVAPQAAPHEVLTFGDQRAVPRLRSWSDSSTSEPSAAIASCVAATR